MSDDHTIPILDLDGGIVAFLIASRQIESWIRTHGHDHAELMCRKVANDPMLPAEYREALQSAFGG